MSLGELYRFATVQDKIIMCISFLAAGLDLSHPLFLQTCDCPLTVSRIVTPTDFRPPRTNGLSR